MSHDHINPIQWNQAIGYARQAAARIFRDGGNPADAMRAFGVVSPASGAADWSKAVEAIAGVLCEAPRRKAA